MFVGHLALALLGKRATPRLSLGTAALAVMLADLLVYVCLIAGIERIGTVSGVALNRIIGIFIPYSHSLATDLLWAALFAAIWFHCRRDKRAAWILFALVLSHWPLDVLSHRPDMPLVPGAGPLLGIGLWNSMPGAMAVEGSLWLAAVVLYRRSVRFTRAVPSIAFSTVIVLLTLAWHANIAAGMDPNPRRAGISGLASFSLVIAWAYWMDRSTVSLPPRAPASLPGSSAVG